MAIANFDPPTTQAKDLRLDAKRRLLELGLSITQLAKDMGLARNTVSIAINHPTMLPGVKKRIRKHLRLK
jgi:hypothetical protein